MDKEKLRPVEYTDTSGTNKGWFLGFEQVICNQRQNGSIEDVEAYVSAIIENENGEIVTRQIDSSTIRFLDRTKKCMEDELKQQLKKQIMDKLLSWKDSNVQKFLSSVLYKEFCCASHKILEALQEIEKETGMIQMLYEIRCPECYRTLFSLTCDELNLKEYETVGCDCGNEFEIAGDEEFDSRHYVWRFIK